MKRNKETMSQEIRTVYLLLVQLLLLARLIGAKVPALIVFGDSLVDPGNNDFIPTIVQSNFLPYGRDFEGGKPTGRFSNGRLSIDFIAEAFKIKRTIPAYLDPAYSIKDFATGVSFASAATGYDTATSSVLKVIPLWKELEYFKDYQRKLRNYLGNSKANMILNEALYIITLGTNDFLENYYVIPFGRSSQFTIEEYEIFLIGIAENFIVELHRLGGWKVSLAGLPPMGCLPWERAVNFRSEGACNEEYNMVARDFNEKLQTLVTKLRKELEGLKLVYTDVYGITQQVIENPNVYGFENVHLGCCGTGTFELGYLCNRWNPLTCKGASKYVFWDSFHGTEKTYQIVADHMMKTSLSEFLHEA